MGRVALRAGTALLQRHRPLRLPPSDELGLAEAELKKAREEGNVEEEDKQQKRLVRAGTKENEDCKKLLRLMGVPVINAPCEAEAQAAALARVGAVWAAGTEDMDCLTFRTPIQIRKMTFATAKQSDIQQLDYAKALSGMDITHDQFVDLCILMGCDYSDTIKGIGPVKALQLIKKHGCIEKLLEDLDKEKYVVPEDWPFDEARKLFKNPDVVDTNGLELKFTAPDEEGMKCQCWSRKKWDANVEKLLAGDIHSLPGRSGPLKCMRVGPSIREQKDRFMREKSIGVECDEQCLNRAQSIECTNENCGVNGGTCNNVKCYCAIA